MSPFYAEEFSSAWGSTQTNVAANLAIIGTNYLSTSKLTKWCRPVASFDMPVHLITVSEIEFFKAEYYARYGSAGEAAAYYAVAIEASFASAYVPGTLDYAGTPMTVTLRAITK